MTACPPDDRLTALLADTPGDADTPALDAHLADCSSCQARLDALCEPPRLAEWIGGRPDRTSLPFLDPPDRPGDLGRVGRYRVEAELGRGGMGVVLRAWDDELRRHVALKVMRVGRDDEQAAARFAREARAVASLRNDHVVAVHSVEFTRDGRLVVVMPVVTGPSLRDVVRTPPGLAPREAVELVRQVADGLAAAHAAGVIHRDVKPANVLIEAATGRAKLTDFGLARAADDASLTHDGTLVGTPEYMSPEQAADPARADARADVYSLGVTLYECLTGVVPFRGAPLDVVRRHAAVDPIPPRRLNAAVPADLDTICLKCLEKAPARRYDSAAAVRDDLDRWLTGRPVLARPLGAVGRAVRWCRRNPLPVAIVVVAAVGAAASAAGWRQAWLRADEAATNADTARTEEAKAIAARQLADEKSALAEERSALALGAVTTLITKAQDIAGDSPGTLRVKRRLTEAALADLRKLSAAAARVPGADHAAVTAHLRLGEALNLLGQSDEAIREYDRARDRALQLVAADPADHAARRDQSRALSGLAVVRARLAQFPAAEADAHAAVRLARDVVAARPADAQAVEALGVAHGARGDVFTLTGRTAPALADYDAALGQYASLLPHAADPAGVRSRLLLLHGRVGYANILLRHDYATAERHFRDQLAVAAGQLAKTPDDRTWQRNHLIVHLDLSAALQRQGRTAEAEALANDALPGLEKAAAADPDNALTQRDLATGFTHRGRAQLTAGRYADAEKSLARGLDILQRVAARAETVSLVAADLPVVHLELAIAVQRQERFADAAKHIAGLTAAVRRLVGPGIDTPAMKHLLADLAAGRAAVALTGEAAADPKVIDAQPPAVALRLASERATLLARRGDLDTARREAVVLCARAPGVSVGFQCRTLVEGVAAGRAADPAEKEKCIAAGVAALTAAVKLDRSVLDTAHLYPELVTIRTAPAFVRELRAILGTAE